MGDRGVGEFGTRVGKLGKWGLRKCENSGIWEFWHPELENWGIREIGNAGNRELGNWGVREFGNWGFGRSGTGGCGISGTWGNVEVRLGNKFGEAGNFEFPISPNSPIRETGKSGIRELGN